MSPDSFALNLDWALSQSPTRPHPGRIAFDYGRDSMLLGGTRFAGFTCETAPNDEVRQLTLADPTRKGQDELHANRRG